MRIIAAVVLALALLGTGETVRAQDGDMQRRRLEHGYLQKAVAAYEAKRIEESACAYIAAIRLNPMNPDAIYNLACCLAILDRKEQATACLAGAWVAGFRKLDHIRQDPDLASLRKTKDYRILLERFAEVLELEGLGWDRLVARAVLDHQAGRYEAATRAYFALLRREPTNASVLYNLACCFSLMEKPDVAVKALATAWVAGFRNLDHILRDRDFEPIRQTPAFRDLMRRFALDLQRTRQARIMRMQMFAALARQQQSRLARMRAAQAQAFGRAMAGWGRGGQGYGGNGGNGGGWSWRSNNTDVGGMGDGNGFVGFVGKDWSYCVGD